MGTEAKSIIIDVLLTEYSELRSEQRDVINRQYSIISWSVTLISSLFGLSVYFDESLSDAVQNAVFYVLIPCASSYMGIFWIDHVYRQIRIGTYILSTEDRINTFLGNSYKANVILNWEHYLKGLKKGKLRLLSTKRLAYYFVALMFASMSVASIIHIRFFLNRPNWMIVLSIIAVGSYLFAVVKYCNEIKRIYSTTY